MSTRRYYIKGRRGRVSRKDFVDYVKKEGALSKGKADKLIDSPKGNINDSFTNLKELRQKTYKARAVKSAKIRDERGRYTTLEKETKKIQKKQKVTKDEATYIYNELLAQKKAEKKKNDGKFTSRMTVGHNPSINRIHPNWLMTDFIAWVMLSPATCCLIVIYNFDTKNISQCTNKH